MPRLIVLAVLSLLLAACGGREDNGEPRERVKPETPPISLPQLY